jgi:hypothetical protein
VDVVDHEQRRRALGQVAGQPHQPVDRRVHGVAGRRRLRGPRVQRALREGGGARGELGPVRARAQRLHELAGDPPGGVAVERATARSQDRDPLLCGGARRRAQQARLADPRRALHDDDPPGAGADRAQPLLERVEFRVAIEQQIAHAPTLRRSRSRRQPTRKVRGGLHDARRPARGEHRHTMNASQEERR